jgi:diguanylate cyclase (GGDEF)-like protein
MWVDTTLHNYLADPERKCVMVELIDISAEMQAQEALHEHEELLRRLTDAMPVGLLQLDTQREIVYNNARLLEILYGSDPIDLPDAPEAPGDEPVTGPATPVATLLKTLMPESLAGFQAVIDDVLSSGADRDLEVDIELPSGAWRRALMSVRTLLRSTGEVSGAIICVLDVTDSARARRELEQRATFDNLTQVHNRSSILHTLERELEREDSKQTGVLYLDLDKFKPVNDTLGHAAGDELLALVAERLRIASRDSDVIGRLGGDEFLIVLRELPDPGIAMQVAERFSMALCGNFELSCGEADLTVSIGVACGEAGAVSADELVKQADWAMYRAKSAGNARPVLAAVR